jgi:hypothetical protein
MVLIGIVGKMGVGKDYIYNSLIKEILESKLKSHLQLAFADQIKVNVMSKKNIEYKDVYLQKTQETRVLLQNEGTEEGRLGKLGKDIWIKYIDNWIKVFTNRSINNFVITDCRFLNEIEYIKNKNGILIKIIAPQRNIQRLFEESNGNQQVMDQIKSHYSECDLDQYSLLNYDLLINNDPGEFNKDIVYKQILNLIK